MGQHLPLRLMLTPQWGMLTTFLWPVDLWFHSVWVTIIWMTVLELLPVLISMIFSELLKIGLIKCFKSVFHKRQAGTLAQWVNLLQLMVETSVGLIRGDIKNLTEKSRPLDIRGDREIQV